MKKQLPAWAVLLVITLAAGLCLGGVYALTKDAIADQAAAAAEAARHGALPEADAFEALTLPTEAGLDWCYAGLQGGRLAGYVAQATVQGFGGPLEVVAGVNLEGALTGVSAGGSGFAETAGLGARAKEPAMQHTGFTVIARWDEEARVWVAISDDVPGLATEADTLDELEGKLAAMVPELLELNGVASEDDGEVPIEADRSAVVTKTT